MMKEVKRSALLPYSARQVFDLVADIERYPEFLPGCVHARVIERHADGEVDAELGLQQGPAKLRFATRNRMEPGRRLEMTLHNGPLKALDGCWEFHAIGDSGCRVELWIRFDAGGTAAGLLLSPLLESVCNRMVDAFSRRATELHG
ncbi:MAG: type II toxin-antitoxin system RatA family toxin [Steroidobacteraceae bacterium]|jgi:ribosome-associated toxin RatA of RatAB toxin-antitoxin module